MGKNGDSALAQRFPANAPVRFYLVDREGTRLEPDRRKGILLDVSNTGGRLSTDTLPEPILERLRDRDSPVRAEMTITVGSSDLQIIGEIRWAKNVEGACVLGVEYLAAEMDRGEMIAKHFERAYGRPRAIRTALLVALVIALIGAAWNVRSRFAHEKSFEWAREKLELAQKEKETLTEQLNAAESAARDAQRPVVGVDPQVSEELKALREEIKRASTPPPPTAKPTIEVKNAQYYLRRGNELFREGNFAAALLEYQKAIKMDPRLAEAYLKVGMINEFHGEGERAVKNYNTYLKMAPNASDAYEVKVRVARLYNSMPWLEMELE